MRVVVFKYRRDLIELKELLYGTRKEQLRGLAKCKAYEARGSLPTSVHLTCLLLAAKHADLPSVDLYAVRLTYSMALIRFVNEILDSQQQAKSVIPLYGLAKMCGLPEAFVELRHAASHENLPSVDLLRDMTTEALQFLWDRYWSLQKEEPAVTISEGATTKDLFREWRRIRRGNQMSLPPPPNLISALRNRYESNKEEFLDVVLNQNVLMRSASTSTDGVEKFVAVYLPALEGIGPDFCSLLLERIVQRLQSRQWPVFSATPEETATFASLEAWAEVLAKYMDAGCVASLSTTARPWNAQILLKYAAAVHNKKIYDIACEMAEVTGCEKQIPQLKPGWNVVANWTPRPLGT